MAPPGFHFVNGAVHLPPARLWLDAHSPIGPEETVFVSHAHSDHTAAHSRVILTEPTQRLMRARVPGLREEHVLEWGRSYPGSALGLGDRRLTLLPAGHILGSAMSWIEEEAGSLLYTGDFKLRQGLSAEPCEPRRADILIMETTYGRPEYQFPPAAEVMAGVIRFCREAIDNDEVPVLLGYSLGKSQEVLSGLAEAGLPVMLGEPVARLTRVYESLGRRFPAYAEFDPKTVTGHVVLAPPGSATPAWRRRLGKCQVAVLTGWAVQAGAHFRYQADAAFPLSDHADFPDLVEFVKRVAPRQVFTLHGFAADFAAHLRRLGFDARALGVVEQLELPRFHAMPVVPAADPVRHGSWSTTTGPGRPASVDEAGAATFLGFCRVGEAIGGVASKSAKANLLASYLARVDPAYLPAVVTWFTGVPFAAGSNRSLDVGWALIRAAVCKVAGVTPSTFRQVYLKYSDTGETVAELLRAADSAGRTGAALELSDLAQLFERLESARGSTSKLPWLTEVLGRCEPSEARFLVKILTGDLRIGLKEGLVEEAVAEAFQTPAEVVRSAHQIMGDLGETARLARAGELEHAGLTPFRPIRVMLASPEPDAESILQRVQEWEGSEGKGTVWVEDKYDGIRCQLHRSAGRVRLFSRDLKEMTESFPDLIRVAGPLTEDVILDGELVAMEGDRPLPFAELQRRLGRREPDLFLVDEIPLRYLAFDLLWQNGRDWMREPLSHRRAALEALPLPPGIQLAHVVPAETAAQIDLAFQHARERGHEGLIIKDPASAYTPGRRGLSWLKLKRVLATLDCVVVGAEYGHGRRRAVLSDYTFALRDEPTGELRVIGKAYSGLTNAEIDRLTAHFLSRSVRQSGRYHEVVPDVVLEIAFDSIRASQRHDSGLALRFPRIARIRDDKTPADIDTVARARRLAKLDR